MGKEAEFSVITGDILYNYDQEQIDALSQLYLETPEAPPTLFAPGNFDLLPQKKFETAYHHFYTPEDYFLFISTNQKGETTQLQQHYILNQILDLEKMDTISTVFIFIDRANWVGYDANLQSMSQMSISNSPSSADSFMIQQVLPRLEKLPSKNIYIISGDMKPNQSAAQFSYQKEGSNITFLASGLSNTTGDRFIEFSKNAAKWSYSFKKVE